MHPDPNDPRLTAFALGELDELPAAERTELEQHLSACPACRQEVDRLQELGAALSNELVKEPLLAADVRPIRLPGKRRRAAMRRTKRNRVLAIAACTLIIGSAGLMIAYERATRIQHMADAGNLGQIDRISKRAPKFETKTLHAPSSEPRANDSSMKDLNRTAIHPNDPVDKSGFEDLRDAGKATVYPSAAPVIPIPPPQQGYGGTSPSAPKMSSRKGRIFDLGVRNPAPPAPVPSSKPDGHTVYPVQDLVIPIRNQPASGAMAPGPQTTAPTGSPQSVGSVVVNGGTLSGVVGSGAITPRVVIQEEEKAKLGVLAPDQTVWDSLTAKRSKYRPIDIGPPRQADLESNTEAYDRIVDHPFLGALKNPLSTFSIDVDTASYSNVRRFLMEEHSLPPKDAVRIEELINYFSYDYAPPKDDAPFAAHIEAADCPWQPGHRLVRIGLKGRVIADDERPASNLVFLLDVSGSMEPANKLPLVRQAMSMLVRKLGDKDRVAIVVYQGASGLVLPSTSCEQKETVLAALEHLQAGGSTNGGEGIQLAYQVAGQNLVRGGTNRVILCTDGDFNVGITNRGDLTRLIEKEAAGGVFLTVLGFGMGNLKDATLEQLADKGNGNYGYIDSLAEARKLLVDQLGGTLVTIAKDVKIQVEFNPDHVGSYRLIGYENRMLRKEDFNDDKKDAGEIGAGHTVTALYEVVPPGQPSGADSVDPLKYQKPPKPAADVSAEMLTLKLRYKQPDGQASKLIESPFIDAGGKWATSSHDFRFAAAVAAFGMILRDSPYKGHATIDATHEWAVEGKGEDRAGYRGDFFPLLDKAKSLLDK